MTQPVETANGVNKATSMQVASAQPGTLQAFLESPAVKGRLEDVAKKFMKADDLVRLALMAASRQPEIAKCSHVSVLRALMDAAAVGIVPGGTLGRGYIVPRKNRQTGQLEATFDPGWRGLIDIARRTGKIKRIEAHVAYERDEFRVQLGLTTDIHHVPNIQADDRGAIIAAYALAEFHDGSMQFEVLSKSDINKIRGTSSAQNGPWKTWEEEMSRKSAVRRLCKYLPIYDSALEKAMDLSNDADIAASAEPPTADVKALEAALMASNESVTTDGEIVEEKKS